MGWKEAWDKYQVAVTFAEAGEREMALHFLQEAKKEEPSPGLEDHPSHEQGKGLLRPSHAEG